MNETVTKEEEVYRQGIIKAFRNKVPSHKITSESLRLGMILAIIGGFLDAYTFISRGGVFANAETGNMVLLALGITTGALIDVIKKGPKNNLTVYNIRGAMIALREEEGSLIMVKPIHD